MLDCGKADDMKWAAIGNKDCTGSKAVQDNFQCELLGSEEPNKCVVEEIELGDSKVFVDGMSID